MGRTELFVHLYWATWAKAQSIDESVAERLHGTIRARCIDLKCLPVAIGGTADHVHLLARLNPTVPVCRLAGEAKDASAHLMNRVIAPAATFRWQDCYGAITVDPDDIDRVARYVLNQPHHHQSATLLSDFEPFG